MPSVDTIILLIIAIMNVTTGWLALKARGDIQETRRDVKLIELATNSMKDALVAKTGEAARAAGRDEERTRGEEKAKHIVEGQQQERANYPAPAGAIASARGDAAPPLPVADDRTAVAAERSATATERVATAAEDAPEKP